MTKSIAIYSFLGLNLFRVSYNIEVLVDLLEFKLLSERDDYTRAFIVDLSDLLLKVNPTLLRGEVEGESSRIPNNFQPLFPVVVVVFLYYIRQIPRCRSTGPSPP
jgi:hypothetical protein